MAGFEQLDAPVLGRLFSFMLQREALLLVTLASEWPRLVAAHLRRLMVSPATPLRAALCAAPYFQRLVELVLDGRDSGSSRAKDFWGLAATLLGALLRDRQLERLVLRDVPLKGDVLADSVAQLKLLETAMQELPQQTSIQQVQLEQVPLAKDQSSPTRALGAVTKALRQPCPSLTSLLLSGNDLLAGGAEAVLTSLCAGHVAGQLLRLDLSLNGLGAEGAASLGRALPCMTSLEALLVHSNAFGGNGMLALAEGLPAVRSSLVELDLAANGMGAIGVEALTAAALPLQTLSLRRNWLDARDAQALPPLLQTMAQSIVKLDMAQNKLAARGVQLLLMELPPMPALRLLDLAENQFITADFATAPFARLAEIAPHLEDLNLTACKVGSDSAAMQAVFSCLPPTLEVLHLGAASLQSPRLGQLFDVLPQLPRLRYLGLVQARLDDATADALVSKAPLLQMPQLQVLNISGNLIGKDAAARLAAALRQGPAFKQLKGARA